MAHRTLIRGTTYEISGGKTLVNGSGYHIAGGKTLVNGTAYEISFGTPASSLAVGSSLYFNVNGVKKEFLVVQQGRPSSMYDSSCDGTWVLIKDLLSIQRWNKSGGNSYQDSDIHSALNGTTFLNRLDADIQSAIKQVKIPYVNGTGSGGSVASGASGLSTKLFLLSGYEVGWTNSDNTHFPKDGTKLTYFDSGTGTAANNKRVANTSAGNKYGWWLRSPYTGSSQDVWHVGYDGDNDWSSASTNSNSAAYVRYAFVLPSNFDITNYLS